jgi:hypothetical protein
MIDHRLRRLGLACSMFAVISVLHPFPAMAAGPARAAPATLPGPVVGVDAVAPDDVWAVGSRPDPADDDENKGLAEHWNGHAWTEFPTPRLGVERTGGLVDVSLSSSDEGFAVGSKGQRSFRDKQIVVEHWDGHAWSLSPAPDQSFNDILSGVASVSPTDAWAVGAYSTGGTGRGHMLIEHWNGSTWQIMTPPPIASAELNAVHAISANDVWAAGFVGGETLTLHWNGTKWKQVASPSSSAGTNELVDLAASGPNDVWAVGTVQAGGPFPGQTLVLHWNGVKWRIVHSASPASGDTVGGVAVTGPGDAWVTVTYWPTAFEPKALAEHFSGGARTLERVGGHVSLNKVDGVADQDLWAAGGGIFHWNGVRWREVALPPA